MNKRGFTLIELLAVIVILAIIAVIAVPIVLNIIDESKENANLRSADFYLDAVEMAVANSTLKEQNITDGDYNILPSGNICLSYDNENKCNDELTVEVNGEVPDNGTITITGGKVSAIELVYDGKTIVQDNGNLVYKDGPTGPTLASLCEFKEGTEKTIGAKYECDFGGGVKKFYILDLGTNPVNTNLEKDEVALILEGNYDTTKQPWCAFEGDNSCNADGLTTKLDSIAEAWSKLEREQIVLPSAEQVATADGKVYTGYPTISSTNAWLYNWPDNANYGNEVPYGGYWTSTPNVEDSNIAWLVGYDGYVTHDGVGYGDIYGVRPVVNLKI